MKKTGMCPILPCRADGNRQLIEKTRSSRHADLKKNNDSAANSQSSPRGKVTKRKHNQEIEKGNKRKANEHLGPCAKKIANGRLSLTGRARGRNGGRKVTL